MRLGQTSVVHFLSQLVTSVVGFLVTVYLARTLGSEVLGTYFLVVALVLWLQIATGRGIQTAVTKRLSEIGDADTYLTAGVVLQVLAFVVVSVLVLLFREPIRWYVGFDASPLVVVVLFSGLLFSFVRSVLEGENRVHVSSLLRPVDRVVRSALQVAAVLLGFGVVGLLAGYAVAGLVAGVLGVLFVATRLAWPERIHFERLLRYARYSWLSAVESRAFSSMDTLVLGAFVSSGLIGIYEIAWNLASVLAIFGVSISRTMFPAMSELASRESEHAVAGLVDDALAYAGLFIVPGLVGGLVVGDRVLALYGREFPAGATVLVVLLLARLLYAYESQFVTVLGAIDRPDVAFRINATFVLTNLVLNVVLVWRFGWVGAAVATTASASVGLVLGYRAVDALIDFDVPMDEIAKQWLAAGTMGGVVYAARTALGDVGVGLAIGLVVAGAGVYFLALFALSERFRTTVQRNLPSIPAW